MKIANQIETHMTEYPAVASKKMTVTQAAEIMKESRIRHLPVVENGEVVGVVSDRDLRQAIVFSDSMTLVVSDIMSPDPYCVTVGTPLSVIAKEMSRNKYGCTVILNRLGRVVGIFTTTDGMRILSDLLTSPEPRDLKLLAVEDFISDDDCSECLT